MPELPEVETVCRGLAKSLNGKRIRRVDQHRPDLRHPMPKDLAKRLEGHRVLDVSRRAKYIRVFLDSGDVLLLHLGMSGRMLIVTGDVKPGKHDHLVFHFADNISVTFNDPRRFGSCDIVAADELEQHKWLRHTGIEPLGAELTPDWLKQKLKGKKTTIKAALLDQRLIAGLGNIYVCEALFYAGISPRRPAGKVKPEQIAKLVPAIRKVLNAAIKAGGSSLRDYRQANGELGYFQHNFAVYGREGECCPGCDCDPQKTGGIRRITQSGRSSFFCGTKQL